MNTELSLISQFKKSTTSTECHPGTRVTDIETRTRVPVLITNHKHHYPYFIIIII